MYSRQKLVENIVASKLRSGLASAKKFVGRKAGYAGTKSGDVLKKRMAADTKHVLRPDTMNMIGIGNIERIGHAAKKVSKNPRALGKIKKAVKGMDNNNIQYRRVAPVPPSVTPITRGHVGRGLDKMEKLIK